MHSNKLIYKTQGAIFALVIVLVVLIWFFSLTTSAYGQTIYFKSNAETGDLSEWNRTDGIPTGGGATYFGNGCGGYCVDPSSLIIPGAIETQTAIVHSGNYAIRCHLENPAYANHAKLLRWKINISEGYYSAWIYFDSNFRSDQGINIIQWKTAPDVCPSCEPLMVIEAYKRPWDGRRLLRLIYWPAVKGIIPGPPGWAQLEPGVAIPDNSWIFVEAYFKQHPTDGKIVVWQDGKELFNISGLNTTETVGGSCFYSAFGVGAYSSESDFPNQTIYFDDILVTKSRVFSSFRQGPTNLRIIP